MPEPVAYPNFQRWMAAIITHPGEDEAAWKSDQAIQEVPFEAAMDMVKPTSDLDAFERIAVYRRMYFLRMRDVVEIDFPGVSYALRTIGGDELFEQVVWDYCAMYPSRSYTLNLVGMFFPTFLGDSSLEQKQFVTQLAELELTLTQVMDADESPVAELQHLQSLPPEQWENVRLIPVTAFALRQFSYPVHDYLDAVEEQTSPQIQDYPAAESFILIHRHEYSTRCTPLTPEEYALLHLFAQGMTIGGAISLLLEKFPERVEHISAGIFSWFQTWLRQGVFQRVES